MHGPWMEKALIEAQKAQQQDEVPVGAIVVAADEKTVLGCGYNRTLQDRDPSAHAEMIALRHAAHTLGSARLEGCSLYVTLEPCPMCAGAIIHARIKRLIFGAYDPRYGAVIHGVKLLSDKNINHHPEVIGGIAETECSKILRNFFRQRR